MCGITGFINLKAGTAVNQTLLAQMNQAQFHRGPDEGGEFLDEHVALGHRRLSIIDLSSGQQPMLSDDSNFVLIFNGEIYNFKAVRAELEQLGHHFNSHSDTEVILHAYMQWSSCCVDKLQGMFTFAIWDKKEQTLFIARDRLGIKPLFYAVVNGTLYFASELKSISLVPALDKKIDAKAIEQYFALGYVAEPHTIYQQVAKLSPGHILTIKVGDTHPIVKQYWDVSYAKQSQLTEAQLLDEMEKELKAAVESHMMADVPLGSFLSGGVDSSAVVAMMSNLSDKAVATCSIGFDVENYNETDFARQVAKRYATEHQERVVASDDFDLVDSLAQLYDEPYADSSAMPTYRVCQLAREKVTVCLSGDGADELLAGYRRYSLMMNEEKVRSILPYAIRKPVFGLLGKLYPKLDWAPQFLRAKTTFQSLAMDTAEGYFHGVSLLNNQQRKELFSPQLNQQLKGYSALDVFREHQKNFDGDDPLSLIQYIDIKTYLVGDILTKVDRASMAHSLEVRVPFLDHKFVEWTAQVPTSLKLKQGCGKYLLKKSMEAHLPEDVLYRNKMGFRVPLADWFKGPLREKIRQALLSDEMLATGLFNMDTIKRWLDDHQSGRREYSAPLWTLLMFASFYKQSQAE
ncbi:XrtA/PEP-CTERM system amidotransferase [Litorilituus lipolyticus]|uniref:asparagine synthase (glutamine-hydrolyzing) n=1 Tax=Litorilituus lipolyticus TaxID=2491017 RepID=A0A502KYJ9_9GAMM|nr:XrtA/PEP-CTERM system amidotransferase [Litorilituus lipolyticus]TPH13287.1 amidotransferase 1, exosortase A system-associated [Litorilituus lipolyticus]